MKKKIVYSLLFMLAIVLQASVLPVVFSAHAPGDVVLMLVLAGAIADGFFGFFGWAIFAGILYDLATFEKIGVHALIFLLVTYFVSFFSRRFSVELKGVGVLLFAVFVVVASIVSRAVISLLIVADISDLSKFPQLFGGLGVIVSQIIYNLFLFIICFYLLKKVKVFFDIN